MQAVAVWLIATLLVSVCTLILLGGSRGIPSLHIVFEAVSAFGTVGLSTGALAHLPTGGLYVLIMLMLVGRLGILALILAMTARSRARLYEFVPEEVTLG